MIFALRHPAVLLGLLVGFLVGVAARAALQRAAVARGQLGRPRLRRVGAAPRHRPRLGWAGYLDPYGAVAAVLAGPGWGPRVDVRRHRHDDVVVLVVALVVHAALTAVGLALFVAAGGHLPQLNGLAVSSILHGSLTTGFAARDIALGFALVNLGCGVLALVPIPPLELGVVLWSRIPRTPGARRVAYRLLEEQWGVVVILVLLLLQLGGNQAPLISVIDAVGDGLFGAF